MSAANQLRLTYLPYGGLAAVARLILNHAGIAFEDVRIPGDEIEKVIAEDPKRFPMATVPVLEIDGGKVVLSQTGAITNYCARGPA